MCRAGNIAYVATGLLFSGVIMHSIVQDQDRIKKSKELEHAQKEIQKLREELAEQQDTKSTIGFLGLVGTGLAVIGPAVLKAMN